MQIYNFSKDNGKKIGIFNSNFIMSRIIETNKGAHIGCMYLEENGIIGYHQATIPQLLLILDGEGYVCDEKRNILRYDPVTLYFGKKMNGMKQRQKLV